MVACHFAWASSGDGIFDARIVLRQQRVAFQVGAEQREPDASQPQHRGGVQPVDVQSCAKESRFDGPKDFHDVPCKNQPGNGRQPRHVLFHDAEQQKEERDEKVKQRQQPDDPFPAARNAEQIPVNFTRQIARIDNEQLGEAHVGPENDEGQQQVAEIVKMRSGYRFAERAVAPENQASSKVTKAKAERICPISTMTGNMVEYQPGSADITQSTKANVAVNG